MADKSVSVLGVNYRIVEKNYNDEPAFERRDICGYCDGYVKEIIVCNMATYKGWEHEGTETIIPYQKCLLRHEITHAFLFESGLAQNSGSTDAWASNEEMVDWFAIQGPKIVSAWKEVGAISEEVG